MILLIILYYILRITAYIYNIYIIDVYIYNYVYIGICIYIHIFMYVMQVRTFATYQDDSQKRLHPPNRCLVVRTSLTSCAFWVHECMLNFKHASWNRVDEVF